jgi:hypothetical protein
MRMGVGGRWEVVACNRCSLAVGRRGNEEDNGENATTTNRATDRVIVIGHDRGRIKGRGGREVMVGGGGRYGNQAGEWGLES